MPTDQEPFDLESREGVDLLHFHASKMDPPVLDALQEKINERIASGVRKMVLNLAPVAFVDSFAIGVIVATARAMSKAGGTLKLCGVGERVLMSLTITRLDRTLDIVDDEETAIRSLCGEA